MAVNTGHDYSNSEITQESIATLAINSLGILKVYTHINVMLFGCIQ